MIFTSLFLLSSPTFLLLQFINSSNFLSLCFSLSHFCGCRFDAQSVFVKALGSGNQEHIHLASQGLTNLSLDPQGRASIREATIVSLLAVVEQQQDGELVAKAVGALVNVCYESPAHRQAMFRNGVLRTISLVLSQPHPTAVGYALNLLTNLADSAGQEEMVRAQSDAPSQAVRAAVSHDGSPKVLSDALALFSAVSRGSPACLNLWLSAGLLRVLPRLVDLCIASRRHADLRIALVIAVNFAAFDPDPCQVVVEALARALGPELEAPLQTLALQALQNLSVSDACCRSMAAAGLAPVTVQLLQSASDVTILDFCLRFIQNMAADAAIRRQLNSHNAVSVVQRFSSHPSPVLSQSASNCLNNLQM